VYTNKIAREGCSGFAKEEDQSCGVTAPIAKKGSDMSLRAIAGPALLMIGSAIRHIRTGK
jgi:hypothetical protein